MANDQDFIYEADYTRKTAEKIAEFGLLRNEAFLEFLKAMEALRQNMFLRIIAPASDPAAALRQEYDKGTVNGIGIAMGWASGIVDSAKKISVGPNGAVRNDTESEDE